MKEVQASCRLSSNRYIVQIEIAATPTKQTPDTRANRYKKRPAEITLCLCGLCDSVANPESRTGIRNRRK